MSLERCSFCGRDKRNKEVKKIFSGPGVYVCDICIRVCHDILEKDHASYFKKESPRSNVLAAGNTKGVELPTPKEIKEILDQYIVGQSKVKKQLAVSVHNHYKRIGSGKNSAEVELEKSNVMLIGPTGSGKTLFARTLAKTLNVPFAIADATALTEAGYVGEDVENVLLRLIQAANGDIKRAELGIIYIDEIDKLARTTDNVSITRDVSGEGVQQSLLKILEGTVANVPPQGGRKHPQQEYLQIDTRNILFVCGGTFSNLDKIIEKRISNKSLGFRGAATSGKEKTIGEILEFVEMEDLLQFGFIPEFIGRLPAVATLHGLSEDDLVSVLTEPKNALIKQYERFFSLEGVELIFEEDAIREIAKKATKKGTGARALRSVIEKLMLDVMYDVPSQKDIERCTITKDVVEGKSEPVLIRNEKWVRSA